MSEPIDLNVFRLFAIERLAEIERQLAPLKEEHADLSRKIKAAEFLMGYVAPPSPAKAPTLQALITELMADGKPRSAADIRSGLSGKVKPAQLSTYSTGIYNVLARMVGQGRLTRKLGQYRAAILALAEGKEG